MHRSKSWHQVRFQCWLVVKEARFCVAAICWLAGGSAQSKAAIKHIEISLISNPLMATLVESLAPRWGLMHHEGLRCERMAKYVKWTAGATVQQAEHVCGCLSMGLARPAVSSLLFLDATAFFAAPTVHLIFLGCILWIRPTWFDSILSHECPMKYHYSNNYPTNILPARVRSSIVSFCTRPCSRSSTLAVTAVTSVTCNHCLNANESQ